MSDTGTDPGIAPRTGPGYFDRLRQIVEQIPAAKKLIEQAQDPRAPVWRRGLACVALVQTLLEALWQRQAPPAEPPQPG